MSDLAPSKVHGIGQCCWSEERMIGRGRLVLWCMLNLKECKARKCCQEPGLPVERPILFSGPMVRAILNGNKTMTRRVVNKDWWINCLAEGCYPESIDKSVFRCPYGMPGDRLWVREAWGVCTEVDDKKPEPGFKIYYRADGQSKDGTPAKSFENWPVAKWRPSIHMPRWASRILLEVVAVRVERLQAIDNQGALAEGTPDVRTVENNWDMRDCFRALWDGLNEKRGFGWTVNPWVWVVEFRRVGHG